MLVLESMKVIVSQGKNVSYLMDIERKENKKAVSKMCLDGLHIRKGARMDADLEQMTMWVTG